MILGSDPEILDFWSFDGEKKEREKGEYLKKGNILLCVEGKERKGEINIWSVEEETNKGKGGKYLKMENILLCVEEKITAKVKEGNIWRRENLVF